MAQLAPSLKYKGAIYPNEIKVKPQIRIRLKDITILRDD